MLSQVSGDTWKRPKNNRKDDILLEKILILLSLSLSLLSPSSIPLILLSFSGSFSIYFFAPPFFLSFSLFPPSSFFLSLFFHPPEKSWREYTLWNDTDRVGPPGQKSLSLSLSGGGWLMDSFLRPIYERREKIKDGIRRGE